MSTNFGPLSLVFGVQGDKAVNQSRYHPHDIGQLQESAIGPVRRGLCFGMTAPHTWEFVWRNEELHPAKKKSGAW